MMLREEILMSLLSRRSRCRRRRRRQRHVSPETTTSPDEVRDGANSPGTLSLSLSLSATLLVTQRLSGDSPEYLTKH